MKFASFPKFALLSLLAGVFALVLTGCGASNNLALTPGNWSMTATPSGGGTFYIGGNLTQSGTNVAGTMYVISFPNCYSPSQTVAFTGTVKGKNVTLTSASVGGQVISIIATGTAGSLTGTYSIAGGTTCNGDSGTLTATPVPSISGTWGGLILSPGGVSQGGPNAALAITLTQASTASSNGTFALAGTGTYTNSTCFSTATISSAFVAGPYLIVNGTTDDGGNFFYTDVLLNSSASPTSMKGTYQVSDAGQTCDGDSDVPTFTKQ
jgi:hypothetical protein